MSVSVTKTTVTGTPRCGKLQLEFKPVICLKISIIIMNNIHCFTDLCQNPSLCNWMCDLRSVCASTTVLLGFVGREPCVVN